jgi:predicted acetyltransferase
LRQGEPLSEITVHRAADRDEIKEFVPIHRRSYLMSPQDAEDWGEWVEVDNFRLAKRDGRAIGGMQLRPMGQWFGGRSVRMTGISAVGIEPSERASGAGTLFMQEVLRELHADGVPISSLYPATQLVYRRCGYELAGDFLSYRIGTDEIDVRDRTLEIEHTTDRDAITKTYDAFAARTAGLLDRDEHMWKRTFEPWKSDADAYIVNGADGPEGYVVYSRSRPPATPLRETEMFGDVVALTSAATKRILSFVADHRSFIGWFAWNGAPGDRFAYALAEPRRKVTMSWPWMLRLVDMPKALVERGYNSAVEGELHLNVHDDLIDANNGAFVLRVSGGKAEVTPGGSGSFGIDIRGLAPLYTGYSSAHELLSTGYLDGTEADLLAADALFAGPSPWLQNFF